ncbi:Transposase, partial [Schistosoma japonicum]
CLACSSREISVDLKAAFENTVLNQRFLSWEDVEQAVGEFQSITFTHYIHSQNQSASFSSFKYIFVVFKCAFGNQRRSHGIGQRNKPSKCMDCKSMFRVVLNVNEYIVRSYIMTHNHPCMKSFMRCDSWFRRLSEEKKENINPVLQQSTSSFGSRDQVFDHIRERGQLREFHYVEGNVTRLNRICFSKKDQIRLYRVFPEDVGIDSTFNIIRARFSMFQLVITDNMEREQFTADVKWIPDMFQEFMGDTSSTETFVMDSSHTGIAAINRTHRYANIQLCSFHVCCALCRK